MLTHTERSAALAVERQPTESGELDGTGKHCCRLLLCTRRHFVATPQPLLPSMSNTGADNASAPDQVEQDDRSDQGEDGQASAPADADLDRIVMRVIPRKKAVHCALQVLEDVVTVSPNLSKVTDFLRRFFPNCDDLCDLQFWIQFARSLAQHLKTPDEAVAGAQVLIDQLTAHVLTGPSQLSSMRPRPSGPPRSGLDAAIRQDAGIGTSQPAPLLGGTAKRSSLYLSFHLCVCLPVKCVPVHMRAYIARARQLSHVGLRSDCGQLLSYHKSAGAVDPVREKPCALSPVRVAWMYRGDRLQSSDVFR